MSAPNDLALLTRFVPTLQQAKAMLAEASRLNPGPWVQHSRYVAQAAQRIAEHHPLLDPDRAYILGCLHDIGRRAGVTGMRHIYDGYIYLQAQGFHDAARICLTHSFPYKNSHAVFGEWDCTPEEVETVSRFLDGIEYDAYDRLLQLCDSLALPTGFCLIEKRLVDVLLRYGRHGVSDWVVLKWQATFDIQHQFEAEIGRSIYALLPGVAENTFGFDPCN
jgi:hypothetical protein